MLFSNHTTAWLQSFNQNKRSCMNRNSKDLYLNSLRQFLAKQDASFSLHLNSKQLAYQILGKKITISWSTLLPCKETHFHSHFLKQCEQHTRKLHSFIINLQLIARKRINYEKEPIIFYVFLKVKKIRPSNVFYVL